jgi:hypothetical protein
MLSDITSDRHDLPRCGHCGAPLDGRFASCPSCNALAIDSLDVRPVTASPLKVPLSHTPPLAASGLPVPKVWNSPSRALTDPYYFTPETPVTVPLYQRLRRPLVVGASMVVVTSAVYLGFIHSNDTVVGTPIAVSGRVTTQPGKPPPAAVVVQRAAPVRATPTPPPVVVVAPAPRRAAATAIATASPVAKHNMGTQISSQQGKPRADVSKHLKAAHADLVENNLSATKARLAAAISVDPDNRDALRMRSTLTEREQQRDAMLSLARGCGYIARWDCVRHNAGNALQVDTSSKEAQRLVTQAARESELAIAVPSEPVAAPEPDDHVMPVNHH